ncbi:hypothetical protein Rhopal_001104-T1 [Rhodotorula paludigena]|uniref:Phospholipid binding protein n=1 Tax=Rhodotorula paludigena TaxID=86838 RepID=A0AAV5GGH4_9BASI|nr:hypothetical protein Rhopal_001104-T1 [Rhodotorula paludigena]
MARPRSGREDVVWALHTFDAENEDELTFEVGERIVVLERDDQYGDGWFQGRNERGEIGLFPQSYTSSRPPSFFPPDATAGADPEPSAEGGIPAQPLSSTGGFADAAPASTDEAPVKHETLSPVLGSVRRDSVSETSLHSRIDEDDDDDAASVSNVQRPADGPAHRAALAAKAAENAEKAAQNERDRAAQRKKEDEERYERVRKSGLIEDLQLSDESDDEEQEVLSPLPETAAETPSVDVVPAHESRPRADTQTSTYAESVYSTRSSNPPASSPPTVPAVDVPPAAAFSVPLPSISPSEEIDQPSVLLEPVAAPALDGDATPRSPVANGDATPKAAADSPESSPAVAVVDSIKSTAGTAAEAVSVGAAGLVAAATTAVATAGLGLQDEKAKEEVHVAEPPAAASTEETAEVALPIEAQPVLERESAATAAAPPPPEETTVPAQTVEPAAAPAPVAFIPADTSTAPASFPEEQAPRASTPTAPASAITPQPASPVSADHSRSSTPATYGAPLSSSTLTSATTATGTGSDKGAFTDLPADPLDWTVDEVVAWGRQKGFDQLTLGKFAEHEISGDVLLEMDVAMLKEIDLIAFGRRVHIYNAIKDLKLRTHPPPPLPLSAVGGLLASQSTTGGMMLSPALSGYEPDSPGSFGGPSPHIAQSPQMRWEQQQAIQQLRQQQGSATGFRDESLAGLGFENESPSGSLRAPSSLGQQSVSNLRTSQSNRELSTPAPPITAGEPLIATPIAEEPAATADEGSATDSAAKALKTTVRPSTARPKSSRRNTDKTAGDSSATSTPASPALGSSQSRKSSRGERGEKSSTSGSFFGAALPIPGRTRKPPPRVPSALLADSNGVVPRPRPRSTIQDRAKRSTRLFSSFGAGSGSDRSPTAVESVRSRPSNSTLGGSREAPTTMSVKTVDPATAYMLAERAEIVRDGNLMDKIGRPDHSGWMRKKGEKYNTWKMRFFVLKGTYLYYLKSEAEQKAKGVIDLTGYRVISDPSIHPGEYGFKIVHDRERPHYFAAAEQITVREWMKEIMKATILRDYSAPVVSSCDIDVLSLNVAQTMVPYPRPPSPERRAQIQKKTYGGANPNTLTQKDAAILMDFAPGSPLMNGEDLFSSVSSSKRPSTAPNGTQQRKISSASVETAKASSPTSEKPPVEPTPVGAAAPAAPVGEVPARLERATSDSSNAALLAWANSNLPATCPLATDLSQSLRSGRLLVRLVENLSDSKSQITDQQFDQFHQQEGEAFDTAYLDTIFSVFDFLSPRVSTDDVSMEDMITGNESRLTMLVERIRANYDQAPAGVTLTQ